MFGIYDVSRIFLCKTKIIATYKGGYSRGTYERPMFSFKYEGKRYIVTSDELYSKGKINMMFSKGKQYEILIYEKNPKRILIKKSSVIQDIFFIFLGSFISIILVMMIIDIYILK